MPLIFFFSILLFQDEFNFFFSDTTSISAYRFLDFFSFIFSGYASVNSSQIGDNTIYAIKTSFPYSYNFKTQFNFSYLHTAFNEMMKPYDLSFDKLFGDKNIKSIGKRKSARSIKGTQAFIILYTYSLDYYAVYNSSINDWSLVFYFKKQHFFSFQELFLSVFYMGVLYLCSWFFVKAVEEGYLPNRETDEIDMEYAIHDWYYYRDNRLGSTPPKIPDNNELNFAYDLGPLEWDDFGVTMRLELHFFTALFSFLYMWGITQSAMAMFFFDPSIDLHYVNWANTFLFLFIWWRAFYYPQRFFLFNRFLFRRTFYLKFVHRIWSDLCIYFFRKFYFAIWVFVQSFFSRKVRLNLFEANEYVLPFVSFFNEFASSNKKLREVLLLKRFIYSSFQKDLNLFEKKNKYELLLISNLYFLGNSKENLDSLYYFRESKDQYFSNFYFYSDFFIRNYRYNPGFYFPKNLYLTDNKLVTEPISLFPIYTSFQNIKILPIWGGEYYFSIGQDQLTFAESSESWFFNTHYKNWFNSRRRRKSYLSTTLKVNKLIYLKD